MATKTFAGDIGEDAGYVERAAQTLRQSFFLSLAVLGLFLIGLGSTFELLWILGYPVEDGVIAGMLAIWGTTTLLIGGAGYGTLRYLRNY